MIDQFECFPIWFGHNSKILIPVAIGGSILSWIRAGAAFRRSTRDLLGDNPRLHLDRGVRFRIIAQDDFHGSDQDDWW